VTTSLSLLPWAVQFASQTNASIHFENILRRAFIDFFFSLVAIQRIIGMINKLIKKSPVCPAGFYWASAAALSVRFRPPPRLAGLPEPITVARSIWHLPIRGPPLSLDDAS
jgi:hypothetical protein